jgi:formate hydrogenlyase subunit 3/multisubunit Na+/H+ antiporter MnhD subunit
MMVFEEGDLIRFLFKAFASVLITGIIVLPFVPPRIKPVISVIFVSLAALITSYLSLKGFEQGGVEYIVNGGVFFGEIPLRIDALSAWFIIIINLTCFSGVLYGSGYLKSYPVQPSLITLHWIAYLLFQASMLAVTMVQHSIAFIVAWEIMSLSSLFLVLFDYTNPKVLKAGINYLVQMHVSVVLLTVAFIWVYFKTGTFDFRGVSAFFGFNPNIWLFLVFFAGFGLKSGFLGLHTWLPAAHPAAPSHISGVMSGVIVKMGIYGIFRIISCLKADWTILGGIILTLSLLSAIYGIMNAAVHRDFKKMLAYCTIENIGLIGIGIGLGMIGIAEGNVILVTLGFAGSLIHVLNHSLYKSLLFFSAGSVYTQTHTRDMDKLGGLMRYMPKTAMLFLTGALAIGGLPPLNGFISEFLIYSGVLTGIKSTGIEQATLMILTLAGMSIVGGISVLAFTKAFGTIFLGIPRQDLKQSPAEVSFVMLLPQYLIVALMLFIAFFPGIIIGIAGRVLNSFSFSGLAFSVDSIAGYVSVMKNISIASALFLGITGLVFVLRRLLISGNVFEKSITWGCGYQAPDPGMQYTGKSFSKSFGKLMNFILIEKKGYKEIDRGEIFPAQRNYHSFYLDIIDNKIIDPVIHLITRFINLFQFVQNGRIQAYVIYGIVFILVIFIATFLNIWH